MFSNFRLTAGLLGLALTAAAAQATEPTIDYSLEMKLTYTGTLYSSTDGVNWTKVEGAASPYYVPVEDAKKLFFCTKDESEPPPGQKEDITVPISDAVSLDMIWIKPGTFMMGSPKGELGRDDEDEARHQVTLSAGYWLGKYEVTQAQYEAIMGTNPSLFKGTDLPVGMVTWNDANEFCKKLTAIEKTAGRLPEGYIYSLPTEAQWEYACRAGTTTALNSGKNITNDYGVCPNMDEVGWYRYNSDSKPHPVGQKQPNAWGLYDMHGNIVEWCLDLYKEHYPTSPVTDPVELNTGDASRVSRGGSWGFDPLWCRSAARLPLEETAEDIGFRVALVPVK